ncbi:MAG: hypothetical protein ACTSWN_11675, partial [Promethearchaeota archaeon]
MKLKELILIFKSRTYFILNVAGIIFMAGFYYFEKFIHWDLNKVPGNPQMIFRDFIWLFYWRWNLDYLIFPAFLLLVFIECFILRILIKKGVARKILMTYVVPTITLGFSYLYMLAIDLGVTWFADTGIDGNWESETRIFLGLTAQGLYHTFFFWYIPAIIICALCMMNFISSNKYSFS